MVCGTMCTINHDFRTTQVEFVRKCAFAKFDISPARIIQTFCLAQLFRRNAFNRCVERCLDFHFNRVRQFIT